MALMMFWLRVLQVVTFPLTGQFWNPCTVGLMPNVMGDLVPADRLLVWIARAGVVGKELTLKDPLSTWVISAELKEAAWVLLILMVNSKEGTYGAVGKLNWMLK
jgi:hypothetical protein